MKTKVKNTSEKVGFKFLYNVGTFDNTFYATVIYKDKFKGYLLKNIKADGINMNSIFEIVNENHCWISPEDSKPIDDMGIQKGHKIFFSGTLYQYQRKDGSFSYSIKNLSNIEIVDDYELYLKEELQKESLKKIACKLCLYNTQCYGICINYKWREEYINILYMFIEYMKIICKENCVCYKKCKTDLQKCEKPVFTDKVINEIENWFSVIGNLSAKYNNYIPEPDFEYIQEKEAATGKKICFACAFCNNLKSCKSCIHKNYKKEADTAHSNHKKALTQLTEQYQVNKGTQQNK